MADWAITVADTDARGYIDPYTITIVDGAAGLGNSLTAVALIPYSALQSGDFFKPKGGQVLELTVNGVRLFKGPLLTPSDSWLNPETMRVEISAQDWTFFLNRVLVAKQLYDSQSAGERIEKILDEFLPDEGFWISENDIRNSLEVPEQGYDYQAPATVFDELAEATGFHWYVDFGKQVHLIAEFENVSPLGGAPYYNILDLDSNLEIGDVIVTEDVSGLHNFIIIKDFTERSANPREDTYVSDGEQTFYPLYIEPFSLEDTEVSVQPYGTEEWIPRTLSLDPLDGSPESIEGLPGEAYLCIFNVGLRFPTRDLPQKGDKIKADYKYVLEPRIHIVEDLDSQREMARREQHLEAGEVQATSGVHQASISLPDFRVTDLEPIDFYGQLALARQAWPMVTGTFTTYLPGWRSGQNLKVTSKVRDIFDIPSWVRGDEWPDPPSDPADYLLPVWVTTVSKTIVAEETTGQLKVRYEVSFASQPFER